MYPAGRLGATAAPPRDRRTSRRLDEFGLDAAAERMGGATTPIRAWTFRVAGATTTPPPRRGDDNDAVGDERLRLAAAAELAQGEYLRHPLPRRAPSFVVRARRPDVDEVVVVANGRRESACPSRRGTPRDSRRVALGLNHLTDSNCGLHTR